MTHPDSFGEKTVRTRHFLSPGMLFARMLNFLLGRVGLSVCLRGRRETLYPCMSRRAIRRIAEEICRTAGERGIF